MTERVDRDSYFRLSPEVRALIFAKNERRRYVGIMPKKHFYSEKEWQNRSAIRVNSQGGEILRRAIEEYKGHVTSPELVTALWQGIWDKWGNKIGKKFEVPLVDRDVEELGQINEKGRIMIYQPKDLDWKALDKIFPEMKLKKRHAILLNHMKDGNRGPQEGWSDTEGLLWQPNRFYTESDALKLFEAEGRVGMGFAAYEIGSHFCMLTTGRYFDNDKDLWVRLPDSTINDRVISVRGGSQENLVLSTRFGADEKRPNLIVRSQGFKKG